MNISALTHTGPVENLLIALLVGGGARHHGHTDRRDRLLVVIILLLRMLLTMILWMIWIHPECFLSFFRTSNDENLDNCFVGCCKRALWTISHNAVRRVSCSRCHDDLRSIAFWEFSANCSCPNSHGDVTHRILGKWERFLGREHPIVLASTSSLIPMVISFESFLGKSPWK